MCRKIHIYKNHDTFKYMRKQQTKIILIVGVGVGNG